jgi:hypothetical protein
VVDIKICVLPSNDIRGFALPVTRKGLSAILKALRKDYGTGVSVFFRDSDGDVVTIKSWHDLQYAHRSLRLAQSATPTSVTGSGKGAVKLKLFAETAKPQPPQVRFAATESQSLDIQMQESFARTDFTLGASVTTLDVDSLAMSVTGDKQSRMLEANETLTATAPSPVRGALNYEVLWKRGELLGSGSFGKVYSGISLTTGGRMAVKEVALRRGKRHKQHVQALQLEVKILSSLSHENIIKYMGTEYTKQMLRIFMELATDGTVKDAINEFGTSAAVSVVTLSVRL